MAESAVGGQSVRWSLRASLFVMAFLAPGLGLGLRSWQLGTKNVEAAVDGLGWGMLALFPIAVLFALTFRVSGVGRLGRGAAFVVAVLLVWATVLALLTWTSP